MTAQITAVIPTYRRPRLVARAMRDSWPSRKFEKPRSVIGRLGLTCHARVVYSAVSPILERFSDRV